MNIIKEAQKELDGEKLAKQLSAAKECLKKIANNKKELERTQADLDKIELGDDSIIDMYHRRIGPPVWTSAIPGSINNSIDGGLMRTY